MLCPVRWAFVQAVLCPVRWAFVQPGWRSAVRLLEPRPGRTTPELLRLRAARVRHDEATVVRGQDILDLLLVGFIHKLLIVRDDGLGDCLANRVDLRDETASTNANADVDLRESLLPEKQDGLIDLHLQNFGTNQVHRAAVDAHQATPGLTERDGDRAFFAAVRLNFLRLCESVHR